jgi:predicted transcriptional regulator of viral defense system
LKLSDFFSKHPVFTVQELDQFLIKKGTGNKRTRKALLAYHRKRGRIYPIRRGLYVTVPSGVTTDTFPVDPYLLAAKMADDAVLAYHTALEFYGKAYSVFERFYYLTGHQLLPVRFRSYEFRCVLFPRKLQAKGKEFFAVNQSERAGLDIRITSLERTLVDVLGRPDLGGSWEEIWRSLESIEFFDLDKVIEYALLLENATTVAKLGFFLDQHRKALMVEEVHFQRLRKKLPKRPHYMIRGDRKQSRLVVDWNLIVPVEILERSWAEVL